VKRGARLEREVRSALEALGPGRRSQHDDGPGGFGESVDPAPSGVLQDDVDAIPARLRGRAGVERADGVLTAHLLGEGGGKAGARAVARFGHRECELRHRRMIGTGASA